MHQEQQSAETANPVWPLGHMQRNKPAQAVLVAQHTTIVY
jgi:hypothetical protein